MFHLCLCVGGGAEAGGYFSAQEAGIIFRFHCRPVLVPQAAMKVVLAEGWQFRATLGSDGSVGQSHGHWAGSTPGCMGGRIIGGGDPKHPVPSTEHFLPWCERGVRNSKRLWVPVCWWRRSLDWTQPTARLSLIPVVVFVSTSSFQRSVYLDQFFSTPP